MAVDVTKLNFYSGDPIDKVVATGTVIVSNDGNTGAGGGTGTGPQSSKIVDSTIANPYGKKCFVRYTWTASQLNGNESMNSHVIYAYTQNNVAPLPVSSSTFTNLAVAVSVGVDASTVYFRTANGTHGTVTFDGTTYTYGVAPQVFTINYALFEIT